MRSLRHRLALFAVAALERPRRRGALLGRVAFWVQCRVLGSLRVGGAAW